MHLLLPCRTGLGYGGNKITTSKSGHPSYQVITRCRTLPTPLHKATWQLTLWNRTHLLVRRTISVFGVTKSRPSQVVGSVKRSLSNTWTKDNTKTILSLPIATQIQWYDWLLCPSKKHSLTITAGHHINRSANLNNVINEINYCQSPHQSLPLTHKHQPISMSILTHKNSHIIHIQWLYVD